MILAIDTSTSTLGIAIADKGKIIGLTQLDTGHNHSVALLPQLQALLSGCGITMQQLAGLAVTVGPGSFTGLRIGIATAQALAQATNLPLLAVGTPAAMARAIGTTADAYICPVFDARRNEVYTSLFRAGQQLLPDLAISPAALAEKLAKFEGAPIIICGDGIGSCREQLSATLGERLQVADAANARFLAAGAAILGEVMLAEGRICPPEELLPRYLRLSEAEEKRLQQNLPLEDTANERK
ncbi:MAG: tRNA (adenosine(37)-N6)-threonylcarbamoyltransferase complex dimerization subunit type 1 TsaB [Firmicutes bacterium]|nr:tRNA (adenosine(37)-N6)-threonylcarbamoyltransferase complex dimerization subunit type 1 TsaB [Bacillota bacterium]